MSTAHRVKNSRFPDAGASNPILQPDLTPRPITGKLAGLRSKFFPFLEQGRPGPVARGSFDPERPDGGDRPRGTCSQRPDRCGSAFRTPGQPVEPEDEAVHLR